MTPLYEDPWFTFRFAEDRLIPRFHLEGVEVGEKVMVFKVNPETSARLGLMATALVGDDGWVDLKEPLTVRAGEAFIAVLTRSLCESCRHMREVKTPKGSRFLLCRLSITDPAYHKYPPQPVVRCEGYALIGPMETGIG